MSSINGKLRRLKCDSEMKESKKLCTDTSKPCDNMENDCQQFSRVLRWLDTVFQGQHLLSLSINYVAINKVLKKLTPQLY